MKQWIFVAMVVVSSVGVGETAATGNHAGGKAPQTKPVYAQSQAPKQDPFARLNQLVNACLVDRGNVKSSAALPRTGR
jgi:hypothetical protein